MCQCQEREERRGGEEREERRVLGEHLDITLSCPVSGGILALTCHSFRTKKKKRKKIIMWRRRGSSQKSVRVVFAEELLPKCV